MDNLAIEKLKSIIDYVKDLKGKTSFEPEEAKDHLENITAILQD